MNHAKRAPIIVRIIVNNPGNFFLSQHCGIIFHMGRKQTFVANTPKTLLGPDTNTNRTSKNGICLIKSSHILLSQQHISNRDDNRWNRICNFRSNTTKLLNKEHDTKSNQKSKTSCKENLYPIHETYKTEQK